MQMNKSTIYQILRHFLKLHRISNVRRFRKLLNKLRNFGNIWEFMKDFNIGSNTVSDIYDKFINSSVNSTMSLKSFEVMFKEMGYRYKKVRKALPCDQNITEKRIKYLDCISAILQDDKEIVWFFDVTTICENNFKQRAWSLVNTNNTFHPKFVYNKTHLFLLMDKHKLISFQFFKDKIINFDIINFFDQTLKQERIDEQNLKVSIVVDNATMHKTKYFKAYFENRSIQIIYTLKRHPFFNPAEYAFRFIKNFLKKSTSLK